MWQPAGDEDSRCSNLWSAKFGWKEGSGSDEMERTFIVLTWAPNESVKDRKSHIQIWQLVRWRASNKNRVRQDPPDCSEYQSNRWVLGPVAVRTSCANTRCGRWKGGFQEDPRLRTRKWFEIVCVLLWILAETRVYKQFLESSETGLVTLIICHQNQRLLIPQKNREKKRVKQIQHPTQQVSKGSAGDSTHLCVWPASLVRKLRVSVCHSKEIPLPLCGLTVDGSTYKGEANLHTNLLQTRECFCMCQTACVWSSDLSGCGLSRCEFEAKQASAEETFRSTHRTFLPYNFQQNSNWTDLIVLFRNSLLSGRFSTRAVTCLWWQSSANVPDVVVGLPFQDPSSRGDRRKSGQKCSESSDESTSRSAIHSGRFSLTASSYCLPEAFCHITCLLLCATTISVFGLHSFWLEHVHF